MTAKIPQNEQDAMNFLAMLRVQWPKKFESEDAEDQWLDLMISELKQFPQPILDMACRSLMRKRLRGFPLLGECVEACVDAKRFLEVKHPELKSPEQKEAENKDRAGHYWSFAWEVLRTQPMARQASREGWIHALFWFLVANGRLPDTKGREVKNLGEIRKLQEGSEDFEKNFYPQIQRDDNPLKLSPGTLAEAREWGDAILARRAALTAYVLEGKPMPATGRGVVR
jgi:hypothetical protein